MLKEYDANTMTIVSRADGLTRKWLRVWGVDALEVQGVDIFTSNQVRADYLRPKWGATTSLDAFSGSGFVQVARLLSDSGGNVEISRAGDVTLLDDKFLKVGRDSDGVLPAPGAAYRGRLIRVEGGVGVADALFVGHKRADETNEWRSLTKGGRCYFGHVMCESFHPDVVSVPLNSLYGYSDESWAQTPIEAGAFVRLKINVVQNTATGGATLS